MKAHTPSIHQRECAISPALSELGPVLSRIYSARGITQTDELELSLKALAPFHNDFHSGFTNPESLCDHHLLNV